MVLHFPNLEILRLSLTSGAVPQTVSTAPALAGFDDEGQAWVEPSALLPQAAQAELCRLGAKVCNGDDIPLNQSMCCWPQLLPVQREPVLGIPFEKTPVLFELSEAQLPEVVNEILRLGNDRQSFRPLTDGVDTRVLLRVIGPPYYSLLRALDRDGQETAPRAYLERSPRVWVEIGYTHPLAEQIQPPPGKFLLIQPPRQWTFLDEAKFRDIYEILEFALPDAPACWQSTDLAQRLSVSLRLARGGSADPAELWVLRERGIEQLDNLVSTADDRLLSRLAFAVGVKDGVTTVVLRVRPSKLAPPVLVLQGVGFRPYLKLPNLFLPCDTRLHPPLRRDAVSKLLASEPARVTWLYPRPDGRFTPESLPDEAFRRLEDWVDYVLDHDHQALQAWVQSTRFDFEPFVCRDGPSEPAKKVAKNEPPRPKKSKGESEKSGPPPQAPDVKVVDKSQRTKKEEPAAENWSQAKPSELQQLLREREKQFLELTSPLDAPERQGLWREMALLNTALGQRGDASVCWVNALWEADSPAPAWLEGWLQTEANAPAGLTLAGTDLDRLLSNARPNPSQVRVLAASLACNAHAQRPAADVVKRLGRIQQFLEKHEALLPVRAVWLAWMSIAQLTHGDVLTLARARDRLLERLYQHGLRSDLDLPGFLCFSGTQAGDRFRIVQEQMLRMHKLVNHWIGNDLLETGLTKLYVDFIFAFGLGCLRETTACQQLLLEALEKLEASKHRDEVHAWLGQAFEYRILQVLEGKPPGGQLPAESLKSLECIERLKRYKIEKLRENSHILEPHERIDAYRNWRKVDELAGELQTLFDIDDRAKLAKRLTELLQLPRKWSTADAAEARILGTALELAPRLGEAFAGDLLSRVVPALDKLTELLPQALLLEKGLFLAAHFDQAVYMQKFIARFRQILENPDRFQQLLKSQPNIGKDPPLETLLGQSFRSLRKLGMRDEISHLLERIAELIIQSQEGKDFKNRERGTAERSRSAEKWSKTLKLLLHVAAGWLYFGHNDRALPILDDARHLLLEGDLIAENKKFEQATLVCAYVHALGQAPIEMALPRFEELFRKKVEVRDTLTVSTHYCLCRLNMVEAVVLAMVSDDFALNKAGRRWLDDDEFLVRRRIHRDVRAALSQAGI
jgi:hypothetical protein